MKKNENGFSLVVVLFTIVLFTTIGLSLFTINLNNSKQIKLTKNQLVATDLAEMGIVYYETLFTEYSFKYLYNAMDLAKAEIEKDNEKLDGKNLFIYLDKLHLLDIPLNGEISIGGLVLNDSPNANFKIVYHDNQGYDAADNTFKVVFNSEGFTSTDNSVELKGEITIELDRYINNYLSNLSGSKTWFGIPKLDEIEQLKNIEDKCVSKNLDALNNCKITGDIKVGQNTSLDNKTGVIDGKLIGDNANNFTITNSTLYITSNISAKNNSDFSGSIIYSEGSGDFKNGKLSADNSTLYVNSGATFFNLTKFTNNAILYSGGDLTIKNITGNSDISNSKIFVKGHLSIEKINSNIADSTLICAGSFSKEVNKYKKDNPSKQIYSFITDPDKFSTGGICSLSSQSGGETDSTPFLNNLDVEY